MSTEPEPIWYVLEGRAFVPMCTLCFRAKHAGPCARSAVDYWRKRAADAKADAAMFDERAAQVEAQVEGGAA